MLPPLSHSVRASAPYTSRTPLPRGPRIPLDRCGHECPAANDRRKGPGLMTEHDADATQSADNADAAQPEPRTSRSVRFSRSEWAHGEQAARDRRMAAAELVRHAAVGLANGRLAADSRNVPARHGGPDREHPWRRLLALGPRTRPDVPGRTARNARTHRRGRPPVAGSPPRPGSENCGLIVPNDPGGHATLTRFSRLPCRFRSSAAARTETGRRPSLNRHPSRMPAATTGVEGTHRPGAPAEDSLMLHAALRW